MKNLRAFKIDTLLATDDKPVRVSVTDLRFDQKVTLTYKASGPSTQNELVIDFLKEKGIEVVAQAWREMKGQIHDYTLLMTENFDKRIK